MRSRSATRACHSEIRSELAKPDPGSSAHCAAQLGNQNYEDSYRPRAINLAVRRRPRQCARRPGNECGLLTRQSDGRNVGIGLRAGQHGTNIEGQLMNTLCEPRQWVLSVRLRRDMFNNRRSQPSGRGDCEVRARMRCARCSQVGIPHQINYRLRDAADLRIETALAPVAYRGAEHCPRGQASTSRHIDREK